MYQPYQPCPKPTCGGKLQPHASTTKDGERWLLCDVCNEQQVWDTGPPTTGFITVDLEITSRIITGEQRLWGQVLRNQLLIMQVLRGMPHYALPREQMATCDQETRQLLKEMGVHTI